MPVPEDFALSSYAYDLPEDQIAQYPPETRGASRLMILDRGQNAKTGHACFSDLVSYLPSGCILVANNSRVIHARLEGTRPTGGKAELLLLTPLPLISGNPARVECLIRPAARIKIGEKLIFPGGISFIPRQKQEFGRCAGELSWLGDLPEALEANGNLPLPPYIRRAPQGLDDSRYQTVYASKPGSVAAPTAGLHFTREIRETLAQKNISWLELSLHVGYGTFSPVRSADIRDHKMHAEYVDMPAATAQALLQAKREGRPVIAVGTTSLRAIEGVFQTRGELCACSEMVNIFIYPGYSFQIADGLITNFHLPESTLLMLVSALAGRERILAAYREAVARGYRFFSYGDAMLIKPESMRNNP